MIALMYHDVVPAGREDSSGFPGRDAALYKVTPESFAAHLAAIKRSVHDVRVQAAPPALAITFDDGGASAMLAAELLERHRLTGFFFITANYVGSPGFVSASNLRDLRARGHAVGSHSCSHPLRMGHCSGAQLAEEWSRSRSILEDLLGASVNDASVPGGDFTPAVAEAAGRAGLTRLFTSEPTCTERTAFGVTLYGRFTIQRWTSTATVGALAAGAWFPRARQSVAWNAKKLTKRIGGDRYLRLRRLLLGHGTEVRWGDMR